MCQLLSSACVPAVFAKRFEERSLKDLQKEERRLFEYKQESYEELAAERSAEGGTKHDGSLFEIACDYLKSDRKETRKRTGLDYQGHILK